MSLNIKYEAGQLKRRYTTTRFASFTFQTSNRKNRSGLLSSIFWQIKGVLRCLGGASFRYSSGRCVTRAEIPEDCCNLLRVCVLCTKTSRAQGKQSSGALLAHHPSRASGRKPRHPIPIDRGRPRRVFFSPIARWNITQRRKNKTFLEMKFGTRNTNVDYRC